MLPWTLLSCVAGAEDFQRSQQEGDHATETLYRAEQSCCNVLLVFVAAKQSARSVVVSHISLAGSGMAGKAEGEAGRAWQLLCFSGVGCY